jgi:L-ascorbate metabolism protein UlaG (beta-lactamase superfamily)
MKLSKVVSILILLLILNGCVQHLIAEKGTYYKSNSTLKTIQKDYKGNLYKDGEFQNLYGSGGSKGLWDIIKWKLSENPQQEEKDNENYKLKIHKESKFLLEKRDYIVWLGHASFLIQIDGKKIITDPCLTAPPFYERLVDLPVKVEALKPNYLLVSHAHYDHLGTDALSKFDKALALIPLNMSETINDLNPKIKTQEAGWYQQYDINETFEIFFMPSRHWHRRGAFDTNKILWGSYIIKTKEKTIYFSGDSAYSKHFKDTALLFPSIDIALVPIGAYSPRKLMEANHMNPQEALKASNDLNANIIIPMHYGTFDLGDEPLGEPESVFREIGEKENIRFLDVGEIMLF